MKTHAIHSHTRSEEPTAVVRTTLSIDDIGPFLEKTYPAVLNALAAEGTLPTGKPFARYHRRVDGYFDVEAGFRCDEKVKPKGDVQPSSLPSGMVASTVHVGPDDAMEGAYEAVNNWIRDQGGQPAGDPWEVYITNPRADLDPAYWRTEIVQPYHWVLL